MHALLGLLHYTIQTELTCLFVSSPLDLSTAHEWGDTRWYDVDKSKGPLRSYLPARSNKLRGPWRGIPLVNFKGAPFYVPGISISKARVCDKMQQSWANQTESLLGVCMYVKKLQRDRFTASGQGRQTETARVSAFWQKARWTMMMVARSIYKCEAESRFWSDRIGSEQGRICWTEYGGGGVREPQCWRFIIHSLSRRRGSPSPFFSYTWTCLYVNFFLSYNILKKTKKNKIENWIMMTTSINTQLCNVVYFLFIFRFGNLHDWVVAPSL